MAHNTLCLGTNSLWWGAKTINARRDNSSGCSDCSKGIFLKFSWLWQYFGLSENYLDKMQPQGASSFLGVPFCLFCYKRGCWVTAIDPRLHNLEYGYSPPVTIADCIHNCHLFQLSLKNRLWGGFSAFKVRVLNYDWSRLTVVRGANRRWQPYQIRTAKIAKSLTHP